MLRLALLAAMVPGLALAQNAPPPNFVPFQVDQQRYQQIDEAVSQIPMSRQAHQMWLQIWRGVAQEEAQKAGVASRSSPEPKK